jgi:histidyl-tRNA synthetase
VLVTVFEEALAAESLRLATELRAGGFRVEMYPDPLRGGKDLGKAFKYADARRARFVAVLGQDEIARGEVKIKELSTGQQQTLPRASVASAVAPRTSDLGPRTPDTSHRTSDAQ